MAQEPRRTTVQPRPRREPTQQQGRGRAAQLQAAQRRRTTMIAAGVTALVVVAIAALVISQSQSSSTSTGNGKALTVASSYQPAQTMLAVGTSAPDFELLTVDGQRYQLSKLRGKTVLLEYYAVWCPVCQAEAPTINKIDAAFAGKGFQTLSILSNPYGKDYEKTGDKRLADATDVAWFKSHFAVNHPFVYDRTFATVNHYGVQSYPTLYVIDPKGIIRYVQAGERPYDELAAAITAAAKV